MDFRTLTPALAVTGQVAPADMAAIRAAGFGAILCNRPDGEAPGQPSFAQLAAAAEAAGLAARHVPVTPGAVTRADVAAFSAALDELPGPVLAFCRSGARSEALFSLLGRAA
ncbi:TIGR01244 family sulfur transferase [Pseudoroseicyclus sp. CXY001]|uniref:TIGR01244 family sulfur transferase n=1 Tax=Pseudoroseicyclus sp. CXY001 TaxID=3242492 RepID=UPI00358DD5A1